MQMTITKRDIADDAIDDVSGPQIYTYDDVMRVQRDPLGMHDRPMRQDRPMKMTIILLALRLSQPTMAALAFNDSGPAPGNKRFAWLHNGLSGKANTRVVPASASRFTPLGLTLSLLAILFMPEV